MKRRNLLAGCSLSVIVAGCLDGTTGEETGDSGDLNDTDERSDGEEQGQAIAPEDVSGEIRPDDDPSTVPSGLECEDDEFDRVEYQSGDNEVEYGDIENFSLRVDELSYEYGNVVSVNLVNTSSEDQLVSTNSLWHLQLYTEDGWQDVRGTTGELGIDHTSEQANPSPGDGYNWEILLTEDGIPGAGPNSDRVEICPDLQTGRLRFVYTGVHSDDIAVQFDIHV